MDPQVIYVKYNRNRFPQFQIETSIVQDGSSRYVVKKALSEKAYDHIAAIHQGYLWMQESISDARIKQPKVIEKAKDRIALEFVEGKSLEICLLEACHAGDKAQYFRCVDTYRDLLNSSFKNTSQFHLKPDNEVFLKHVPLDFIEKEKMHFSHGFLDLAMDNILLTKAGDYYCIDYEWIIPAPFPVSFVFFRSLSTFYGFKYAELNIAGFVPLAELMSRYGITPAHREQYAKIELNFQRNIVGELLYNRVRYLKNRLLLSELLPSIDAIRQGRSLAPVEQEKILQLEYDKERLEATVHRNETEKLSLTEQLKAKDDMIALLCNSYSLRIGKAVLWPFRYLKARLLAQR